MAASESTRGSKTQFFELMDTTLRDGEQTEGVSMLGEEKMAIARALLEGLKIDRIEIASARVSKGEFETVKMICDWARSRKFLERIEVLGFVDHKASVDWAAGAGCKVINLLTKGSRRHCETQLRKTLAEHLKDIERTVQYGRSLGVEFNVYLEDWSGGMLGSPDHVFTMIEALIPMGFKRIMLPDTLGILDPRQVFDFVKQVHDRWPKARLDFHGHNDYGLGTANSIEALRAGACGLHVTLNGLGERAGNAPLDEVVVAAHDFTPFRCRVDEKKLAEVGHLTEVFTGKRVAWNKAITGENVFTQTAGIHADGDKKGDLYQSRLTPARFNRHRVYALGKLMGRASLEFNLKRLGIELAEEQKKLVLEKIIELADAKKVVTTGDLPFIISDVLQAKEERQFEVVDFMISTNRGLRPVASVMLRYKGTSYHVSASGDGGFDAFVKALRSIEGQAGFRVPTLLDYTVRIPPGGKTDALVETTITWEGGLKTRGVNPDQLTAAIEATSHAINIVTMNPAATKPKPPKK